MTAAATTIHNFLTTLECCSNDYYYNIGFYWDGTAVRRVVIDSDHATVAPVHTVPIADSLLSDVHEWLVAKLVDGHTNHLARQAWDDFRYGSYFGEKVTFNENFTFKNKSSREVINVEKGSEGEIFWTKDFVFGHKISRLYGVRLVDGSVVFVNESRFEPNRVTMITREYAENMLRNKSVRDLIVLFAN